MTNFFAKERDKKLAEKAQKATIDNGGVSTDETESHHQLMLSNLAAHQTALSSIKAKQEKLAKKIEFLGEWDGYIEAALKANLGDNDNILNRLLIWHIDVMINPDLINQLTDYCLTHEIPAPFGFKRDLVDVIAEQISEYQIDHTGTDKALDKAWLEQLFIKLRNYDLFDEIKAKMHKACALSLVINDDSSSDDLSYVIEHYESALAYNPKIGVKKLLASYQKMRSEKTKESNLSDENKELNNEPSDSDNSFDNE